MHTNVLMQWLVSLTWTPELVVQWQEFFNNASRLVYYGRPGYMQIRTLRTLPTYKDLQLDVCQKSTEHPEILSICFLFLSFLEYAYFVYARL
jgi:hypothetical protein